MTTISNNALAKYNNHTEMEVSVLEAMIEDNTLIDECRLSKKHFLSAKNRELFETICKLSDKEIDVSPKMIIDHSQLDMDHLMSVMSYGSNKSNFSFYEKKMFDFIEVEEMRKHASEFLKATEDRNSSHASETLLNNVTKISEEKVVNRETFQDMLSNRVNTHANMKSEGISGVDTGWDGMNNFTDGWQDGDLIIVGGRPGMGKTALTLDSMRNGASRDLENEYHGKYFSCEMPGFQCIDRWIAGQSHLPVGSMRNPNKFFPILDRRTGKPGESYAKYTIAVGELSNMPLEISEEKDLRLIKAEIRKTVKEHPTKKCVFMIDHISHVKVEGEGMNEDKTRFAHIVRELKELAVRLKVPIILLVQLNRGNTNREDKRPAMSDIRETGEIEQVADVIIFPHREDYYDPEARKKEFQDVEIIVAKARQSQPGTYNMIFHGPTNRFIEVEK
ncbi:replicative DNA helicase [Bacillus cereus]|uniref:replicative DNA helicase n=1 Tax=Bacillus cereus TaxID=1396 RepID=UPI00211D6237|nr:replicative DNA helicase [Bacillus cereus]